MRAITEDEFDILLIVLLALIAISALMGWFPYLGQIFPALTSGMFRFMDLIKNQVPGMRYI